MQVEYVERRALLVVEQRPRADAFERRAPGIRLHHLGRVGKPERAALPDAESRRPIQNRGVFTALSAVTPSDADHSIVGKGGQDLVDLKVQRLLQADDIRRLILEQRE